MARLESNFKMGFYPTPERTLVEISRLICFKRGKDSINLLDPCCGDGFALSCIRPSGSIRCRTWGVELDIERADAASKVLDESVQGSIFDAHIDPADSFGLLWLNPPYDSGIEGEREEMRFFKHSLKWLCKGGVLVFIVPERILADERNRKRISEDFYDCRALRVHRDDYPAFKQAVLFGKKRSGRVDIEASFPPPPYTHIEDAADFGDFPIYEASPSRGPEVFRCKDTVTGEEIERNRPQAESRIKHILSEREMVGAFRPLFPLRKGHLVSLITAGLLNGKVHNPDGSFILIKGYSERVQSTRTEDDREITTDTYQVGIRVLDPRAGRWYDIT